MGLYFHKTPMWLQKMYSGLTWSIDSLDKTIYLTFDDGPIPEVTSFVLNQLKQYDAKATFFCVGHNIEKYPLEFNEILEKGHSIGNHTFNHLIGWNTSTAQYLENTEKCQKEIEKHIGIKKKRLFRPPHGRISRTQIAVLKRDYDIVMWTYLTGDFDISLEKENCLKKAVMNTQDNDVVVFHDSLKAYKKLSFVLPEFLKHFSKQGFQFKAI
ncbi:polysaccharide deacetylase family protein [Reichenbachiella sp. MALMAid0571]|uniref:polysaccharide deacetylase family protein n=1 Tax=Reichenbachiella sp. MALMAid0571 TaxID=3143939 RepID=UPI0032E051D2